MIVRLSTLLVVLAAAAPAQAVDVWLTTGDQTSLLEQRPTLSFLPGSGSNTTKIQIDPTTSYQSIEGFGAAMTDSSAWLIQNELNTTQRDALMEQLFSSSTGIGMSFVRIPMGSSDFALSAYTYDDMPLGQTDPSLVNFSIAHDQTYIIPLLQQAASLSPGLKIMATPWTPPAWMKTPETLQGGVLDAGNYATYAQYFVKFIQAYGVEGLPIYALSVQNEPLKDTPLIPSAGMTAIQQGAFIGDHLGPALAAESIETKILAFDHNWEDWSYPVDVMNDPEANLFAAGSAFHGYAGDVSSQTTMHNAFPGKDIYFTEVSGGAWAPNFADNLVWSFQNIIIGTTRNWAKTAIFWNLALDENSDPHLPGGCDNCRGVVTINTASGAVTYEVEYYTIGHASKFVQPGARRIDSDSIGGQLETVAFRHADGTEVLIALNPNASPQSFDAIRNGEYFSYELPGQSVATFVWQAELPGLGLLRNPGFLDLDTDTNFGDGWGNFGNTDFADLFGGNPHASLYADFAGNSGGVFQQGIQGAPGVKYQFSLVNTRIESSWDADLLFGLEYYAADDTTKLGETIVAVDTATRIANGQVEGNAFSIQGTAVAGTAFVRPIFRFENVNPGYAGEPLANAFVFNTFMSQAPFPGDEYLMNPSFLDGDDQGDFGDYWGKFGNVDFNELFGPGNPHASLYADTIGNTGAIWQQAILATPGAHYRFDLSDVRVEANFDADLYFGLEYYGDDDFTKLGETIVQIDTTTTGDGLTYAMIGTAAAGTVYVRPIVRFDNVGSTGGVDRNVFIFTASLTELAPGVNLLTNPGFEDLNTDLAFGDYWGKFFNADFNDFWGGNPHASLFGDFTGNSGGVFQLGIPALPGETYQFDLLNTRIETSWDADLIVGLEYYAADDTTKLGETIVTLDTATRIANGTVDGNVFSMQGTAVAGTEIVRPICKFENVNPTYAGQPQASAFVFYTFLGIAPAPGESYLKNPDFLDIDGDAFVGDYWGKFGNTDFNEFFGSGNPHASLFADTIGNTGTVFQQAILGTPGADYRFELLDVRIEDNFDADLYFGLEYYSDDDFTKIGETIVQIDTNVTGDGLSYSLTGTAAPGTVYVRPVILFDNVGSTGGTLRDAFVFACSLTEFKAGDMDCDDDVDMDDVAPFVEALLDPVQYAVGFPDCDVRNADINGDQVVDGRDIDGFVQSLIGS